MQLIVQQCCERIDRTRGVACKQLIGLIHCTRCVSVYMCVCLRVHMCLCVACTLCARVLCVYLCMYVCLMCIVFVSCH